MSDGANKLDAALDREAGRFADHPKRTTAKWVAYGIAVLVALSVIGNALGIANIYWEAGKAKLTAAPRVTKAVYSTENIIQQVNLFHERCNQVQEKIKVFENNYERLTADRVAAKDQTDPLERYAAVQGLVGDQQDVTAALNAAQGSAAEYDAAAASPTSAPFRTIFSQHGLPTRIDLPAGSQAAYHYKLSCG